MPFAERKKSYTEHKWFGRNQLSPRCIDG